jgi:glycerophosphoryl diester phosphodiesterase
VNVLSHRGYWKDPAEKNTEAAFRRSFALGFGTETDVRDRLGTLVISHDPPTGGEMTVEAFFALYAECGRGLPLALNIKADGLQQGLAALLARFEISASHYFVFDMAVPDAVGYLRRGMPVFTRRSELEPVSAYHDQAAGIWADAFFGEWADLDQLAGHLAAGKRVCLVSPELHGRLHRPFWSRLAEWELVGHPALMLCTDFPEEARALFAGRIARAGG